MDEELASRRKGESKVERLNSRLRRLNETSVELAIRATRAASARVRESASEGRESRDRSGGEQKRKAILSLTRILNCATMNIYQFSRRAHTP